LHGPVGLDILNVASDPFVGMIAEALETLALTPPEESGSIQAAVDVAHRLAVFELFLAELRTFLAEMVPMTATRELLVRKIALARPAEMSASFSVFLLGH